MLSCTRDDVNLDQHATYEAIPESLVTYAEKELSDYMNTPNVNENNFRLTMQYWQEVTYVSESNYNFTNRNVSDNIWGLNYINVLNNLQKAKDLINVYQPAASEISGWEVKKKNQLAIIDMMMVYTYQNMVDLFGNIPYSQALNNAQYQLPAYDNAADIYASLITRLNSDIANITTGGSFGSGDVYYKGDLSKWKKFGNSLLLKLGISLSDVNPTLAKTTITSAISGGVMTSLDDSCKFQYLSSSPNYNPIYENVFANNRDDFFGAKPLVDFLNSTNDNRVTKFFDDVDGAYIGQFVGQPGNFEDFSAPGTFAYTSTTPGNILTYTEVAFYLAEAAARFNLGGDPKTLYDKAVSASFLEWGLTNAQADDYLTANPFDAVNWKKSIGQQAWVAMYNQANVSYNFYRRLDYPVLVAPLTAISNAEGKVPVRLQYPTLEASTNGTNYTNAGTAIGGDKLTTKLFWDKF